MNDFSLSKESIIIENPDKSKMTHCTDSPLEFSHQNGFLNSMLFYFAVEFFH